MEISDGGQNWWPLCHWSNPCARQHVALDTNLRKAADTLGLVCRSSEASESPPAPKRPRLSLSSQSASHGSTSGITTSSPDVAVSVLAFKAKNCSLLFLSIQIHVGYTQPKTFVLTLHRKRLGKAVARKSKKTIAAETLKENAATVLSHTVHVHSYRYSHGISILLGLGTPSIVPLLCAISPQSR